MNLWQKPIPELGLYLYSSAVDDIADQVTSHEIQKTSLLLEMATAIHNGKLRCRNPRTAAPITMDTKGDELFPYVTVNDVNSWLETEGFPYRWQRLTNKEFSEPAHKQLQIQEQEQEQEHQERNLFENVGGSCDLATADVESSENNNISQQKTLPPLQRSAILKKDWPGKVNLDRLLSDVPSWLEPARAMPGRRGRNGSALWDPVHLAICLQSKKGVPKAALTQHLRTYFPEYLPTWHQLTKEGFV